MLLNFIVLVATGIMRFAIPFSLEITRLHMLSGFAITLLIGFHIFGRLKSLKTIIRPSKKQRTHWSIHLPLFVSALLCGTLWSAAWYNWPGAKQTIELSYEARHQKEIFRHASNISSSNTEKAIHLFKLVTQDTAIQVNLDYTTAGQKTETALAIWAETKSGSLIETLYLSQPLKFTESPTWEGKTVRRGDILPIWRNRYSAVCGIDPNGQTDLQTGPTKNHKFSLNKQIEEKDPFLIYVEINAANDNQPSVLYAAQIDPLSPTPYTIIPIVGTGQDSFTSGEINYDLESLTTAKELIEKILVKATW